MPLDHGQHWAVWLAEWAVTNYQGFVAEPALVDQFLSGAINPEAIAGTTDAILGHLVDQGFTIARGPRRLPADVVVRPGRRAQGHPRGPQPGRGAVGAGGLYRVLDRHERGDLPHLRQCMAMMLVDRPDDLRPILTTALAGIASSRGEPWPTSPPSSARAPRRAGRRPGWSGARGGPPGSLHAAALGAG